jgi:hypothetical protein
LINLIVGLPRAAIDHGKQAVNYLVLGVERTFDDSSTRFNCNLSG